MQGHWAKQGRLCTLLYGTSACQIIHFAVASVRVLLCVITNESVFCDVFTNFSQIAQCVSKSFKSRTGVGQCPRHVELCSRKDQGPFLSLYLLKGFL